MNKKIIVIPDSFKGSMSSETVADIISTAIKEETSYEPIKLPIADGGEGSTNCVIKSLGGEIKKAKVHSPENQIIEASYGITKDNIAVIEIAESSGITKQSKLNPLIATTFGFGELIKDALDKGARKFLLCLGGSATTDCGCGMAAALGVKFIDDYGEELIPTGATLLQVANVDMSQLDKRIRECSFTVMSDVENPLYGENGAAYIFAPQKGADENEVGFLDEGLRNISSVCEECGLVSSKGLKGAGAAGGAGYGCVAFLGANIVSGINAMLDICKFDELVINADMIITGEGKLDSQSLMGKVVGGIMARSIGKPMVVFCGICTMDEKELEEFKLDVVEIGKGISLEESIANGEKNLRDRATKFFKEKENL